MRSTLKSEARARPKKVATIVAGVWAGAGAVTFLAWAAQPSSVLHRSLTGVLAGPVAGLVFIVIPGYLVIVGRNAEVVSWSALHDRVGRQALQAVLWRGLTWAASAVAAGVLGGYAFEAFGIRQLALF